MLKILIWQVSEDTAFKDKALKILEQQHDGIEIVGSVTSNDFRKVDLGEILLWDVSNDASSKEKAIKILERNGTEIIDPTTNNGSFKIEWGGVCNTVLAVGAKKIGMSKVTQDALKLNLPAEKLLGDWIVCIPGFTLEKYRRLQRSHLSIIARSCFGGLISNTLGLPFYSPFINLTLSNEDFLKFLTTPHDYMEKEISFKKMSGNSPKAFPYCALGDLTVAMVHYKKFKEALGKWNERKKKINWYNLLVTTYTDSEEILEQFDALPYGKKVCFVPFKSDLYSAFYLNQNLYDKPSPKERITEFMLHDYARGNPFWYDPFDLLLYGKKTPLIDM